MVFEAFKNFYYAPRAVAWAAYDPEMNLRTKNHAESWEVVSIEEAAIKYRPDGALCSQLDAFLTKDVCAILLAETLDEAALNQNGFSVLKNSSTRVVVHEQLPNWIIKVGVTETRLLPLDSTIKAQADQAKVSSWKPLRNINLLRAPAREYFIRQLEKENPELLQTFNFPEEYIYTVPHADQEKPDYQKYFAICEKKAILSPEASLNKIKEADDSKQREIADKVAVLIKSTRLHDWHTGNLMLHEGDSDWQFEIIDKEPIGIMIDSKDSGAHLFQSDEHILHGLISFRDRYCRANGLTSMAEETDLAIVDYLSNNPQIRVDVSSHYEDPLPSTWFQNFRFYGLIILSIVFPLLPLIILIGSIISYWCSAEQDDPNGIRYAAIEGTPGMQHFAIAV